eukprot:scaffold128189_cov22-Tisochrysis_lutea.AAC.2
MKGVICFDTSPPPPAYHLHHTCKSERAACIGGVPGLLQAAPFTQCRLGCLELQGMTWLAASKGTQLQIVLDLNTCENIMNTATYLKVQWMPLSRMTVATEGEQ